MIPTGGTVSMILAMVSLVRLVSPTPDIRWRKQVWGRTKWWPLLMMVYLWLRVSQILTPTTMSTWELVCASVHQVGTKARVSTSQPLPNITTSQSSLLCQWQTGPCGLCTITLHQVGKICCSHESNSKITAHFSLQDHTSPTTGTVTTPSLVWSRMWPSLWRNTGLRLRTTRVMLTMVKYYFWRISFLISFMINHF